MTYDVDAEAEAAGAEERLDERGSPGSFKYLD